MTFQALRQHASVDAIDAADRSTSHVEVDPAVCPGQVRLELPCAGRAEVEDGCAGRREGPTVRVFGGDVTGGR